MHQASELCEKIRQVHPDIGKCGIDVSAEWDDRLKVWTVDLKRGNRELKTFMEPEDADACMEGRQCVSLGIQIAQLKDNVSHV